MAHVGQRVSAPRRPGTSKLPVLLTLGFVAALAAGGLAGRFPVVVLGLYAVASVVAFCAYWWDKSAARNGHWRTRESTLHLFALVGGWPGALAAQRLLRHKSSRQEFQRVFWLTVFGNCVALGWLTTDRGAALLRSVMSLA